MPNIKSAIKRVRVTAAKNLHNKNEKSSLKTALKKASTALASGENTEVLVKAAISKSDKAAAKGIISKNAASRKKSQLAKAMNK